MARLSGWKRIGIIASVVWILGGGIYSYKAVQNYEWKQYSAQYDLLWDYAWHEARDKSVLDTSGPRFPAPSEELLHDVAEAEEYLRRAAPEPPVVCDACKLLKQQYYANHTRIALKRSAPVAFIPVPVGWGLAYLILFLVNWVKRGFISPGNSN